MVYHASCMHLYRVRKLGMTCWGSSTSTRMQLRLSRKSIPTSHSDSICLALYPDITLKEVGILSADTMSSQYHKYSGPALLFCIPTINFLNSSTPTTSLSPLLFTIRFHDIAIPLYRPLEHPRRTSKPLLLYYISLPTFHHVVLLRQFKQPHLPPQIHRIYQ